MAVFELARYSVGADKAERLIAAWEPAVAAVRARFPGLIEANLAQLDERTWIDVWRWETAEAAKAAAEGAPSIPEAAAMFGLIDEVFAMEHAEIAKKA